MKLITWPYVTPEYLTSQDLSLTFPERFWSKVQITPTHWLWMGSTRPCSNLHPRGHGMIQRMEGRNWKIYAHRAAWILCRGPIPDGKKVLHRCPGGDIPHCVCPFHLELGDDFRNMQQMTQDGNNYFSTHIFRGEDNHASKLTDKQREYIEAKHASGQFTLAELASEYGVGTSTIHRIVHRKVTVS